MLSILIPIHNYNVFPLVTELHKQCLELNLAFEILCQDDASNDFLAENEKINTLENCGFDILDKNIGRSAIRNLLAKQAKFENLLFLDSDTIPVHTNFIQNYIATICSEEKVVYGGILYQPESPAKDQLLRWIYGKKRESLSVFERNKNPYLSFLTLNFLIKKSIFNKLTFNENIPNLRHEDTLFSYELSQKEIKIIHIQNPIYHLGIENSETFLRKSEEAVLGLKFLIENNLLPAEYVKISKYFKIIQKYHFQSIFSFCFAISRRLILKQLLSKRPSLLLFDLYRLGYLCTLN